MKKVDNTLINNLARLAKLDFETNSLGKIKEDLEKIILFIKKLDDIDTRNVEPLIYINTENNNEKVDLPKEFLMVLSDKHTIKLPELGSGKYKTDWRAMASDGHVIKGKFTFEIY